MATVLERPEVAKREAPAHELPLDRHPPVRPDGVDKVTGRARFGADLQLARHAGRQGPAQPACARQDPLDRHEQGRGAAGRQGGRHARRLPRPALEFVPAGEMMINYRDVVRNVMAREKVLYEGHAVAAVAATSAAVARQALHLIEVDYEVLPHVLDLVEAMRPDAPLLHDDMITAGVEPPPERALERRQARRVRRRRSRGRASPRPISSSSGPSRPSPSTRAISSRTPASPASPRTARPSSGARPRASTSSAPTAPRLLGMDISKLRVTAVRDRRRLRRQDGRLSRAAGAGPLAQVPPSGQDGDDARGGVPGHRADLGCPGAGEDGRHEGRPDHRGRGRAGLPGGRLPGRAGPAGCDERLCALRHRACPGRGLRRGEQPARRSRPIGRRARRSRSSRSSA